MTPLIATVLTIGTEIVRDRLAKKSTIDGAAAVTAAAAVSQGMAADVGLPPDSIESYAVSIVLALFGLYRIWSKK